MGLATRSLGTFVSRVAIFVFRFPLGILAARFLGAEGKGLLYLLITSVMLCSALGSLGIGTASVYLIGKDRTRLPVVVGNCLAFTGVIGVFIIVGGWMFLRHGRPDIYAQFPLWIWGTMALLVPLHLMQGLFLQVLSSVLRIKEINLLELATTICQLLLFLLFVVIMNKGMEGAFLAYVFADFLGTVGFLLLVLRLGGRPTHPDFALFRASLRFGIKDYLSNVMRHLIIRLDVFLVASFAVNGVAATGIYSIATNLAELVLFIPMSVRLSLFPMVAASNEVEANRLTPMACRHTMFLTMLLAGGLGIIGPFAIGQLYGEAFVGAIIPLLILLPGVVLVSQAHIFYSDLNGRGKPGATAMSAMLSLGVTIILDITLIPRYGIIGASIASTCAYAVEFLAAGSFFIRYSGTRWRQALIFQRSDFEHYLNLLPRSIKDTTAI